MTDLDGHIAVVRLNQHMGHKTKILNFTLSKTNKSIYLCQT
jgi:hypothetical protein